MNTINNRLLDEKRKYLATQFLVHSQNLARADMPGARAQYVEPFARFVQMPPQGALKTTHKNHLHAQRPLSNPAVKTDRSTADMTISGNNINAEAEMAKISQAATDRSAINELQKADIQFFNIIFR